MTSNAVSLNNVGYHYGKRQTAAGRQFAWVLQDLSFDVPEGTSLGVVGNNGAGKSTLLALLAGIVAPDIGTINNGGRSATLLSLNAGLDPNLSGRDNAMLSGLLLGLSKRQIRTELDNIKNFSGLGDYFHRPTRTYSTGMRARLGFAVSVYLEPDILLIDEVVGVGDIAFRGKSQQIIQDRMASSQTVVLVSHSLPFIQLTCDMAIWLEHGRMKSLGPCGEVLDAYNESISTTDAPPK